MRELLEINNLTVSFENAGGKMPAVKDVSLSLKKGETLALAGESGCGKTVLCKSILKLLCSKGKIDEGEIFLKGENIIVLSDKEMVKYRGRNIAMIFQDPMTSLDPAFSVGEQIAEVVRIRGGCTSHEAKKEALRLMNMVRIENAEDRYHQRPYQFSGGMRQRIAIAVALAAKPELLLADEPTTALDEETQEEILMLLKKLQKQTGTAILFITHDLSIVESMAERVAVMKDGRIVEEGCVKEVFTSPKHEYTKKLLGYLDYKKGRGHNHRDSRLQCRQTLMDIKHLYKSYDTGGKKRQFVINDMNMSINDGEIVGLVGKSGSGKSTLSRCIMGLERPDSGEINIRNGIRMQMIFQDPMASLNPRKKVEDIIGEGLDIHHMYKTQNERREKVEKILEKVGLAPEHAERYPHQFSGGQRQRVGIARALIMNPKLIIADECISALDVSIQAQVVNLMKDIQQETGTAYLFIAHDLSMVKYISDRIGVLHLGHLLETGTTEEIFANPIHPYTRSLLSAIPLPNPVVEKRRVAETYDYATSGIDYSKGTSHLVSGSHYVKCTDEEFAKWCK